MAFEAGVDEDIEALEDTIDAHAETLDSHTSEIGELGDDVDEQATAISGLESTVQTQGQDLADLRDAVRPGQVEICTKRGVCSEVTDGSTPGDRFAHALGEVEHQETIRLGAGEYEGNFSFDEPSVAVSILGAGPELTVLRGGDFDGRGVFTRHSGDLLLSGVTITGGDGTSGGGIESLQEGTLILVDSVVSGNRASFHGGGIFSTGGLNIHNSRILNNFAVFDGGGIFASSPDLDTTTAVQLTHTVITGNETDEHHGARVGGLTLSNRSALNVSAEFNHIYGNTPENAH